MDERRQLLIGGVGPEGMAAYFDLKSIMQVPPA
jgi:hypothetical protein